MHTVSVRQAHEKDIPLIEDTLLNAAHWMQEIGLPQWAPENLLWEKLSLHFAPQDFYLLFVGGICAGCMALIDYDPHFWPGVAKGESLFIHKLAINRAFSGQNLSGHLIALAKETARARSIPFVRLDCHQHRPKVRAVYEKNGFVCVREKLLNGRFFTAFYECKV